MSDFPDTPEGMLALLQQMSDQELQEMLQAQEALERRLAESGPQDDDELHSWMLSELGLDIPRVAVCEGHDPPFIFLADLYFERTEAALLMANRGGSKCVAGDTLIYDSASGRRLPIKDVVRGELDEVLTVDNGRLVKTPINYRWYTGENPVLRVKLCTGREIVCTPEHPLLTAEGWKRADELAEGAHIALPSRLPHPESPVPIPASHVDLLALVLAEGCYSQNVVLFSTGDEAVIGMAHKIAAEFDGVTVRHRENYDYIFTQGKRGDRRVNPIRACLTSYGIGNEKAAEKKIPEAVFKLPAEQLARFLSVFWMCDGWVSGKEAGIGLASRPMLEDIQHLLLRFGVQSRIRRSAENAWTLIVYNSCLEDFSAALKLWGYKAERLDALLAKPRNTNAGRPALTPTIMAKIADRFAQQDWHERRQSAPAVRERLGWSAKMPAGASAMQHGGVVTASRERLEALCDEGGIGRDGFDLLLSPDLWWDEIVSIEDAGTVDTYDLTITATANFIANDIVSHNTFLVAVLHWLNSKFKPGCESCTFGATEAQSLRAYAHLKSWIYDSEKTREAGKAIMKPEVASSLMRETIFRNGSRVEVLPGTPQAVNGPHPQKAHADEIELMDDQTWKESQPIDTLIPTPNGMKRMGDLRLGDEVFGRDGRPTKVIKIRDYGEQEVYKITFTDGRITEACGDHLWVVAGVSQRRRGIWKVVRTSDMIESGLKVMSSYRYGIPHSEGVEFGGTELPLHPYVVGVLLGDGYFGQAPAFRSIDQHIVERVRDFLPDGYKLVSDMRDGYENHLIVRDGAERGFRTLVDQIGLDGTRSATKFIPDDYKFSSAQDRLEILRGLLDTDGCALPVAQYATISQRLAEDVRDLVFSLGGRAILRAKNFRSEWSEGKLYTLDISFADMTMPFTLPRKVERMTLRQRTLDPSIKSIEPSRTTEVRCIGVDNADSTYLTNNYIVTHNSRNMTVSKRLPDGRLIIPQDIATSTRKGPNGRMQELIDEIEQAVSQGYKPPRKFYKWCFPPGTPVRTLRGFVPIEDVCEGDMVLSAGGKFRRVTATHVRQVENETIYTIKTPTNPPIMATGEHPFMAVIDERAHDLAQKPVNKRTQGYSTDWVDAVDLREGAFIESVVPQESMQLAEIEPPASTLGNLSDGRRRKAHAAYALSDDFLWAIGLYIAEGHAAQGVISYALHEDEQEYVERLRNIFEGLGFTVGVGKTTGRCVAVNVYSTQLSEWWSEWIGSGSDNKKIPSEIFTLNLERLRHVVEGVMDGDGSRSVNTLFQTSPMLAMQMAEIALREGGNPSLHVVPHDGKKTAYQLYQADGRVQIAPQYATTLTMERKHKQPRGFWRRDERTFVKVERHEKTHYCGPVYDLTVEGDPSFVVGNLLVHNCIKETAAQVKNCQVANPHLPDSFKCPCHEIRKGEWEDGSVRLLRDVCNGDFFKSRGWQPYGDVAKQFTENDRETFEVQQLCSKPEMRHHYVPSWRDEKHCIREFEPDPANGPIFLSVDWGGTNAHAVNWYQLLQYEIEVLTWVQPDEFPARKYVKRLKEGTLVCFDEIYIAEIGNEKLGGLVKDKEARWEHKFPSFQVYERFADPQGKAARLDWKAIGLRTSWHTTREFEEHIKDVRGLFEDDLFYVDGEKCPMFVREIKEWRADPKTGNQIDKFNHCYHGDTLIQTRDGLRMARDLAGETVEVLTQGGEYRPAPWRSYGERPIYEVEFSDGEIVRVTNGHQWVVQAPRGGTERVTTLELLGRRIPTQPASWEIEDPDAYARGVQNGLIYGDGTVGNVKRPNKTYSYSWMHQYGDENCSILERFFERHGERHDSVHGVKVSTKMLPASMKQIPDEDRPDYIRGFLAGLIAADGAVNKQGCCYIASSKREDIDRLVTLCRSVGVVVANVEEREPGPTNYPNAKTQFRIWITKGSLDETLLLKQSHRANGLKLGKWSKPHTVEVVDVRKTNELAEVFCCTEPDTQTVVLGSGKLSSNCMSNFRYAVANIKKVKRKATKSGSLPSSRTIPRASVRITRPPSGPLAYKGKDEFGEWRQRLGEPVTRVRNP